MARRNKRASMREGPLADLFRSTSGDAPADPPEAPRYGRLDPADAKKAAAETTPPDGSCRGDERRVLAGAGRPRPAVIPATHGRGGCG